jgi:hypothetical protein
MGLYVVPFEDAIKLLAGRPVIPREEKKQSFFGRAGEVLGILSGPVKTPGSPEVTQPPKFAPARAPAAPAPVTSPPKDIVSLMNELLKQTNAQATAVPSGAPAAPKQAQTSNFSSLLYQLGFAGQPYGQPYSQPPYGQPPYSQPPYGQPYGQPYAGYQYPAGYYPYSGKV